MGRTMRMTALAWIVVLAGCGDGIPHIAPLHARPAFSGRVRVEAGGEAATGRLAFDRASGHLQFSLETDGDPVSLQRAPSPATEIRAFSGANWRAPRPDESAWFRRIETLVEIPSSTEWSAVGEDGYRLRVDNGVTTVTVLAADAAHGQKR